MHAYHSSHLKFILHFVYDYKAACTYVATSWPLTASITSLSCTYDYNYF